MAGLDPATQGHIRFRKNIHHEATKRTKPLGGLCGLVVNLSFATPVRATLGGRVKPGHDDLRDSFQGHGANKKPGRFRARLTLFPL
jgi:hypothetical protein